MSHLELMEQHTLAIRLKEFGIKQYRAKYTNSEVFLKDFLLIETQELLIK
jgi:hypothetical protein